jgi:uncharacterized glyoxalase superfamily protein PhnB
MAVKPIPEGYRTVTPYLALDDAAEAIEYYKKAFGAKERGRMDAPGGKIGHAELEIGDSLVMLLRGGRPAVAGQRRGRATPTSGIEDGRERRGVLAG